MFQNPREKQKSQIDTPLMTNSFLGFSKFVDLLSELSLIEFAEAKANLSKPFVFIIEKSFRHPIELNPSQSLIN